MLCGVHGYVMFRIGTLPQAYTGVGKWKRRIGQRLAKWPNKFSLLQTMRSILI